MAHANELKNAELAALKSELEAEVRASRASAAVAAGLAEELQEHLDLTPVARQLQRTASHVELEALFKQQVAYTAKIEESLAQAATSIRALSEFTSNMADRALGF